jgi:hypothetical protein
MYLDVLNTFNSPGIVSVIKVLSDGGTVTKLLEGKPGGESKQGRPRVRWLDDVECGLMNEYGYENMGNRDCGRNRMGVCRDGRQR